MAEFNSLIVNGNSRFNSDAFGVNFYADKFIKNGSSDSYVLLGGGGHKLLSDFVTGTRGYIATTAVQNNSTPAQNITGTGHITPNATNSYNLGTSSLKWANIYATTFTGNLSGNASTATKLTTSRNLKVNLASSSAQAFDGSADATSIGVSGTLPFGNLPTMYWANVAVSSSSSTTTTPQFGYVGIGDAINTTYRLYANGAIYAVGTDNGAFTTGFTTSTHINGLKGRAAVNMTAGSGYNMALSIKGNGGTFNAGVYSNSFTILFGAQSIIDANTNSFTHAISLMNVNGVTQLKSLIVDGNNHSNESTSASYRLYVVGQPYLNTNGAGAVLVTGTGSNYREGIRISSVGSWADISLLGSDATLASGTSANTWFIGNNNGNFYITRNGSSSGSSWLQNTSNVWSFNARLDIDTTGRVYPNSTSKRRAGIYGVYDSNRLGHIWSMGTGYMISDDGTDPGSLYGLAYFHTNWSNNASNNTNAANKTALGTYAGGHQFGWFSNGVIQAAIGDYIWSRNGFKKNGSSDSYVLLGGGGHKAWGNANGNISVNNGTMCTNLYAEFAQKLKPIESRDYSDTSFYATSGDNHDLATRIFLKVKPSGANDYWHIMYKIKIWIPASASYVTTSIVEYFGYGISLSSYRIWNTIKSGYAPYYNSVLWLKQAGFDAGYSHLIGTNIIWATNYTNSSWYRYFHVDVLMYEGCTYELLSTAVKYSTLSGYNTTNYNGISNYNATSQGLQETGDNDTITQAYDAKAYKVGDTAIPAYNPIGENTDGLLVPMLSKPFVIDGPMYLNSNQMNANATGTWAGLYYNHYNYQIRNGSNYVDGVIYKPLYLKGTISGILFTTDSTTPYVTALPSTDDGKYYYYLGEITASTASSKYTYLSYRTGNHPIFYYKNGKLNVYGSEVTAASLGTNGNNTTLSVTVGGVTKTSSITVPYATNAGNASTATTWQTARTLTIGNTGKSVNGSANVSWSLSEIGAAAASHTHIGDHITGGIIDTHGEGKSVIILGYSNKFAGNSQRGGTLTAYTVAAATTTFTGALTSTGSVTFSEAPFNGSIAYDGYAYTGDDWLVVDIKLAETVRYSVKVYWSFGNSSWAPKNMKVLYSTASDGSSYTLSYNGTTKTSNAINKVDISPGANITYIRFVFSKYSRLSVLGLYDYTMLGIKTIYMSRWEDDTIGRNLTPIKNNTYNIGSSSYKWANMYATTFHGALDGNAATATLASTVTVNNSDSNSTYRMVWHSGNTLYSTNYIYCNPNSDTIYNKGTFANVGNSNSSGGLSLYGTDYTYGVVFRGTGSGSSWGTHGGVTGDWATYFTMNDSTNRGWIFRRGSTNVASIDGNGRIYVGAVTSSANPGIYWNPYVESSSDGSDAASIYQIKSGVAGGSELRISQSNDSNDVINICAPYYIYFNSKRAFAIYDGWLRINENNAFSSGIYTGSSLVRTDNQFQVGNNGSAFYANSSGNGWISNQFIIGTSRTRFVNFTSTLNHIPPYSITGLLSFGYPVYTDPEFASGTNSVYVYNNTSGGAVTITRETSTESANSSGYQLKIVTNGTASPGAGGFVQSIFSRANAVFVQIFRAKIPTGWQVNTASNSMGTSYSDGWLTEQTGTGKWEWYARIVHCGSTGTLSNGGHVYLSNTTGGANTSVTWYVCHCSLIDITKQNYNGLRTRLADTADNLSNPGKYYWANVQVSSGSSTTTTPQFGYVGINVGNTSGDYRLKVNGYSHLSYIYYTPGNDVTDSNVSDSAVMVITNGSDGFLRKGTQAAIRKYVRVPWGFSSWASGATWGNTTGTSFASWSDSTGGSIDFRRDNPSSGKMSIKVNGRVYVNEGTNPVLSSVLSGNYWGMRNPDGGDTWIRTSTNGLLPYTSGGEWGGHSSLGTSSWYFNNVYTTLLNGIHIKSVYLNNSTSWATNFNANVFGIQDNNNMKFSIIRGDSSAPNEFSGDYSTGIAWKGADTFGLLSHRYSTPSIKFAGGNGTANPVWWMEIHGKSTYSYDLNQLYWYTIGESTHNATGDPTKTKWYKICVADTNVNDNINNDWLIEIYSYSDQNFSSFIHGYLKFSAYSSNSRSLVLSTGPSKYDETYGENNSDWYSPHLYATMSGSGTSTIVWIGIRSFYTFTTKFRIIQEGSSDKNKIIKSGWTSQEANPNSNYYIIDNGSLHLQGSTYTLDILRMNYVDAIYKKETINYESLGYTGTDNTIWNKFGVLDYRRSLPDGLANNQSSSIYYWGGCLSIAGINSRLDVYFSHLSTDNSANFYQKGIYVRSGWIDDKKRWERLLTNGSDLIPDEDCKYNLGYYNQDNYSTLKRFKCINGSDLVILCRHNEMTIDKVFVDKYNSNNTIATPNVGTSGYCNTGGPNGNEVTINNTNFATFFGLVNKFSRRIHRAVTVDGTHTDSNATARRFYTHTIANVLDPFTKQGEGGGYNDDYFEFGAVSTTTAFSENQTGAVNGESDVQNMYTRMSQANDTDTSHKYAFGFIKCPGHPNYYANGACRLYIACGTVQYPGYSAKNDAITNFAWFGRYGRLYDNGHYTHSDINLKKNVELISSLSYVTYINSYNDNSKYSYVNLENIYEWSKTAIIKYNYKYDSKEIYGDIDDEIESPTEIENDIEEQENIENQDPLIPKPGDWNYDYYMDNEDIRPHYGVSAQNVYSILPEVTGYDGFHNIRSVNYDELHTIMIASMIDQIEKLKDRIQELESQIENGNT